MAIAPGLGRGPLDEVVAVAALLGAKLHEVTARVAHAARIDIGNRVAVAAPVAGVGRLELGHVRDGLGRHAHDLPLGLAIERALAVERPGDDQRHHGAVVGTVDVNVDDHAVAHLDRLVLHADDAGGALIGAGVEGRLELVVLALLGAHGVELGLRGRVEHLTHGDLGGVAVADNGLGYSFTRHVGPPSFDNSELRRLSTVFRPARRSGAW